MTSDIPLARGLGSSSSVIVAGIELANQLAHLNLSDYQKLKIATKIEGHPDNVAPAIYGNLVVLAHLEISICCGSGLSGRRLHRLYPDYELGRLRAASLTKSAFLQGSCCG